MSFISATQGFGVTISGFACVKPRVRAAVTNDAGGSWRVTGAALPTGPIASPGQLLVVPPAAGMSRTARLFVTLSNGRLLVGGASGRDWTVQQVPRPVIQLAQRDGTVWAVTCPPVHGRERRVLCRPQVWLLPAGLTSWRAAKLPRLTTPEQTLEDELQLAITPDGAVLYSNATGRHTGRPSGTRVLLSTDGGTWTLAPARRCGRGGQTTGLTAAPPDTFWLLCLNGIGSSASQSLLRSTDGGYAWMTVSTTTLAHPRPGQLPNTEGGVIAAASQSRLWLTAANVLPNRTFWTSDDGGGHWHPVPGRVDSDNTGALDVLDASHAWLSLGAADLWRTTDASHWRRVPSP
jgi:hypothetical protein